MRKIGIADKVAQYDVYLQEKYGKVLKDLELDELEYQVANLQKCKPSNRHGRLPEKTPAESFSHTC